MESREKRAHTFANSVIAALVQLPGLDQPPREQQPPNIP
jgi:hypothetical protein